MRAQKKIAVVVVVLLMRWLLLGKALRAALSKGICRAQPIILDSITRKSYIGFGTYGEGPHQEKFSAAPGGALCSEVGG